jgi:hypothetical protein
MAHQHEKDDAEVGSVTTAVKSEVFSLSDIDPGELYRVRVQVGALTKGTALNEKMHLVNNAIDEIGWTSYQTKVAQLSLRFVPACSRPPAALLPERLRLRGRLSHPASPEHYVRSGRA